MEVGEIHIWPECLLKNNVPINDIPTVQEEIANLARENNIEGMGIEDINELLNLQDEELTNEMLFINF